MKPKRNVRRRVNAPVSPEPALSVVVYRSPGPDDDTILSHAQPVPLGRPEADWVMSHWPNLILTGFGTASSAVMPSARHILSSSCWAQVPSSLLVVLTISFLVGSAGRISNTATCCCCKSFRSHICSR